MPTEESDAPRRRGRGRRPAAEVRRDTLDATARTLFEVGLSGVTFEKVAARAGVSKMTLYKWWPSPGALAFDAYFDHVEGVLGFPDTGDIEQDVTTQLTRFVDLLNSDGGPVIAEIIGAAQADRELSAAFSARYSSPRRQLAVETFIPAQERGQLRTDVDPHTLVDQLWGACYFRLLIPDQPIDHEFVRALVSNLFSGIRGPRAR